MSEKLFLDIGKALEPMMLGFEKVKQFMIKGILDPLTKVTAAAIYLINKLTELVVYVSEKLVQGFKIAFAPIIKLIQKVIDMTVKLYGGFKKVLGLSKNPEKEKEGKDTSSPEPQRDKKFDPNAKTDFNKKMAEDYQKLQDDIFNAQRTIFTKTGEEREKALRELEKTIKNKNQQFLNAYSKSFDKLSDENKKILVGIEKSVNEFNSSNYDFVNEYQKLLKEKESREREILLTLPHADQESALQKLNDEINAKNKEFVEKYEKSFTTLNESNRKIVTALEKQVNEFEKTALDRSFVEAQKALQKKY